MTHFPRVSEAQDNLWAHLPLPSLLILCFGLDSSLIWSGLVLPTLKLREFSVSINRHQEKHKHTS